MWLQEKRRLELLELNINEEGTLMTEWMALLYVYYDMTKYDGVWDGMIWDGMVEVARMSLLYVSYATHDCAMARFPTIAVVTSFMHSMHDHTCAHTTRGTCVCVCGGGGE